MRQLEEPKMPKDGPSHLPEVQQLCGLRIGIITEEVAGLGASGGIGAAMLELAVALGRAGAEVELLHVPGVPLEIDQVESAATRLAALGVTLRQVDPAQYVWGDAGPEKRSYSVYRALQASRQPYDILHFHDYRGLGFYTQNAKRQGLTFQKTTMVVQAHGPTRWALEANGVLFSQVEQLKADFMERRSIETADWLISPSQYLIDWMRAHDFALPSPNRVRVIRNACAIAASAAARVRRSERASLDQTSRAHPVRASEVILFARHEERKGVAVFLDALDYLNTLLTRRRVQVTMLGGLGEIGGHPSGVLLTRRAARWTFPVTIRTMLDRNLALRYLAEAHGAVVVVPSPEENAPYAVIEAALAGRPVLTSTAGGARELLDSGLHSALLTEISAISLAERITHAIEVGLPPARLAATPEEVASTWTEFHLTAVAAEPNVGPVRAIGRRGGRAKQAGDTTPVAERQRRDHPAGPSVVLGITHHERPAKLMDAIVSALRQTYANTSLVVYDDGSSRPATRERLDQIETLLARCGGRLLRGPNRYLGAARNTILRETSSDYIVFLDDDDLALPNMVETLVNASLATAADIVTCMNLFLNVKDRPTYAADPASFECKLSYAGLGGPLSAMAIENCAGPATALFRRSALEKLNGYTEQRDVGYEDYEIYLRALQAGMTVEVVPVPLYLYEIGRPSMISQTDAERNQHRVAIAIDVQSQPAAWKDAIGLLAAQSGRAVKLGRRDWEYSIDPHSDLLRHLLRPASFAPQNYAELLADYASALGARQLAAVWRESTHEFIPAIESPDETSTAAEWDLSAILVLLAGRQLVSAVERCVNLLRKTTFLDQDLLFVTERVVNGIDLTTAGKHLQVLLDTLEGAPTTASTHSLRLVVTAQAAWRLDDTAHATAALRELFDIEEMQYLTIYTDIKTAIGKTELQSGLHHYLLAGRREGRSGFGMLSRVAKAMSIETETGLASIAQRIGVMPASNGVALARLAPSVTDGIAWLPPQAEPEPIALAS